MPEVVVLDYGAGNVTSVVRALGRAGATATVSRDPAVVAAAGRLVFPGQGALPDCMARLAEGGLDEAVRAQIAAGNPYLGICLGLQALFEKGTEHGGSAGLGVLAGDVVRFPEGLEQSDGTPLKVPHMGWNAVRLAEAGRGHPVLGRLPDGAWFYFVHSYYARPGDPAAVAATAEHGIPFCAAVARDNLLACQYHPEKSQAAGEALLRAWLEGTG